MSDRRLAQGQQPANRVDPDAEGIPKENPGPAAAAVPVGDGQIVVNRKDLELAVAPFDYGPSAESQQRNIDQLDATNRLRAALNGEGTE